MLYVDSSALVKRYVAEAGSHAVRHVMDAASAWAICRLGYIETMRALSLTSERASGHFEAEWPTFTVIEIDDALSRKAVSLSARTGLRTLDACHLAAAITVAEEEPTFLTWDRRLWAAAESRGFDVLPESL